jgi:hypothetical protein
VNSDPNQAVRRLAALCLAHGSPHRDTITLLSGLGDDDDQERELRATAKRVAGSLRRKAGPARQF